MSTSPPKVFISATSGDLRGTRQIVKEALLTIGCHPVEQTNFAPDWRTVGSMLRGKIEGCQALIHIAGMRYGAEPDPATLPPGTPRRSYTQMEYDLGCQLHGERGDTGFRVYTFICPESFPYDAAADAEPEEKQALQRRHRAALIDNPRLYEMPASPDDIRIRVLALQEQVLALEHQQAEVKEEVRGARKSILSVLAVVLVLIGGGFGVQMYREAERKRTDEAERERTSAAQAMLAAQQKQLAEGQKQMEANIIAAVLNVRQQTIAVAAKSDDPVEAARITAAAEKVAEIKLARVPEQAAQTVKAATSPDATDVLREMTLILQAKRPDALDAALAYAEERKPAILQAVAASDAAHGEQKRALLRPLLLAASLQTAKGQNPAARSSYHELLKLDPEWPQALEDYAAFLFDQTIQSKTHGTLIAALADAQECLVQARHFYDLDKAQPRAQRVLAGAHDQMGDVLAIRGAKGDADQVIAHARQSLALGEEFYNANPNSAEAARDLSVSLDKLGDFLAQRDQPGDAEDTLKHYTRSLEINEKLLQDSPGSAQARRDVSVSLNKLGDLLAQRAQPGDAEAALKHYTRSLAMNEKLLQDHPNSADTERDVSVSLNKLGDFLIQRGHPGDAESALQHYTRSLKICEKLLQASPRSAQARRDVSVSLTKLGHCLAARRQPGDAEATFGLFTRSLEEREKLLQDNPGSALAKRDVFVSLNSLGDFLAQRGQPGDTETALKHFTRSMELAEKLLQDNPGSAQPTRDVAVILNKLGDLLAQRGKPGDADSALKHYTRSLELAGKLLQANPNSAQAARDVAVSHFNLAAYFLKKGDKAGEERHSRACYDVLHPRIAAGMMFDPSTRRFHEQLQARFGVPK